MKYEVLNDSYFDTQIYRKIDDDGLCRKTCIGVDPEFQDWLRANKDNLPSDIQAKVDDGTLTIAEAD